MPFFILNTLCYMILVHDFVLSFSLFSTLQMIVCPWSPYVFRLQPRWTSSSSERAILEEVHSSDAATTSLTKYKPLIGVEHREIKACHTQWQIFQNYGDYGRKMEFTYSSIVNTYFTHFYITYAICNAWLQPLCDVFVLIACVIAENFSIWVCVNAYFRFFYGSKSLWR